MLLVFHNQAFALAVIYIYFHNCGKITKYVHNTFQHGQTVSVKLEVIYWFEMQTTLCEGLS